jgi:hypothetical protein
MDGHDAASSRFSQFWERAYLSVLAVCVLISLISWFFLKVAFCVVTGCIESCDCL